MVDPSRAAFAALTSGNGVSLMAANPGPDLITRGYAETELRAAGTARSYADETAADYATRVVVRRPESGGSGTLVVAGHISPNVVRSGPRVPARPNVSREGVFGGGAAGP